MENCNVQYFNASVYKTIVNKNTKVLSKYVEFTPTPLSLNSINAPASTGLTNLSFLDINTALASTVEASKNAPSYGLTMQEVKRMLEGEIAKLHKEVTKLLISLIPNEGDAKDLNNWRPILLLPESIRSLQKHFK